MTTLTPTTIYDATTDAADFAIYDTGHLTATEGDGTLRLHLTPREMRHLAREIVALLRDGTASYEGYDEFTADGDELIVQPDGRIELVAYEGDEITGDLAVELDEGDAMDVAVMLLDAADELDR